MPDDGRKASARDYALVAACIAAALASATWGTVIHTAKRLWAPADLHDWDTEHDDMDWDRDYWWKDEA